MTVKKPLLLAGLAKLPKELFADDSLQMIVKLDPENHQILEVACVPPFKLINQFFEDLMLGGNLKDDLNFFLGEIDQRFFHRSKKAVLTATRDLGRVYSDYRTKK